ncbi:hypothetical protein [Winogradskyella helgolandensis]|uniref:hypothetical protein n=1 Tax=Winogradskyella helgolandensis TaxID=2697010 RepID=UPI0015C9DDC9|nr:hypothetical protein [Winogradskyella helgolandensis]
MDFEQHMRYPSGVSEEKLSRRFGLYWDRNMQDWELEISDSGRISDFISVYQNELDNDDDKFTLMGLIVSSLDDVAAEFDEDHQDNWKTCKIILEKEYFLHYSTIVYWCQLQSERDNVFAITPYIREVWEKVKWNFNT